MKLTRREERLFDELAYYTCFGMDYPYENQRKTLRLIAVAFVGGAFGIALFSSNFRLFEPVLLPVVFTYTALIIAHLFTAEKRGVSSRS